MVKELRALPMWSEGRVWCSPERHCSAVQVVLAEAGVTAPPGGRLPTGAEIVTQYLELLSRVPAIAAERAGSEVPGIMRHDRDPISDDGRADAPFAVRFRVPACEHRLLARAVVDAPGTCSRPKPMGASVACWQAAA